MYRVSTVKDIGPLGSAFIILQAKYLARKINLLFGYFTVILFYQVDVIYTVSACNACQHRTLRWIQTTLVGVILRLHASS